MTDLEDQIHRYVAAISSTERPVGMSEVVTRRRHRPRVRHVALVAAALCAVIVAGIVIVEPGRGHHTFVEVAPSTTRASGPSTPVHACPAASLNVTSTSGERLRPTWLPAGFVLNNGDPNNLGPRANLTYTPPGGGDPPRVALLRYFTTTPLAQLSGLGSHHPATVQGRPAVLSNGGPSPAYSSLAWLTAPGIALVVSGYKLSETQLLQVANGVQYAPGAKFTYPPHPRVTLSRADALVKFGDTTSSGRAVLSSLGEVDALSHSTGIFNHQPTIAPGVAVTTPVWVAWDATPTKARLRLPLVLDANSGARLAVLTTFSPRSLSALTDRSGDSCAPPFGVLTRSEIVSLRRPEPGTIQTATLTTQGRFDATRSGINFGNCTIDTCDPTVPLWVLISSATDQRFTNREGGLVPRPTTTGGSWQVIAYDARTGPQSSAVSMPGAALGPGPPPADLVALRDLSGP